MKASLCSDRTDKIGSTDRLADSKRNTKTNQKTKEKGIQSKKKKKKRKDVSKPLVTYIGNYDYLSLV